MLVADPADRDALRSIRHMLVGGEALPTSLAAELRAVLPGRFTNMYGPTETTIWSLCHEIDSVGSGSVPIGRPITNTTIEVLDEFGVPVPVGTHGELHIGGAGVARGYHARPDVTAERFVERVGHGRMYATGDVVRLLPTGVVEFGGRSDFQVKIRGHRVELGEIEAALDQHPDVVRSVVSAVAHDAVARLVAHVLVRDGARLDPSVLREHLAHRLPDIMVPEVWMAIDAFPLTPNGKIDRRALPAPDTSAPPSDRSIIPAADDRERLVADVWREALGHDVGRDENFFDVGGHSLLAVKVFRRLVERTGRELALTDIFRYPTIRALAAHLTPMDEPGDAASSVGTDRGALRRQARRGRRG
jgi:acyl-coenzyme A synthetase/AMP-(fatty) acid ligase